MSLFNALANTLNGGGGSGGGLAQIARIAMQNPQLVQVAAGMLTAENRHGGLAGLLGAFQKAGLGDVAQSWVGTGANQPVGPSQIEQVFGAAGIARIAEKSGVPAEETPDLLAQVLPLLVDQLTPQGATPAHAPDNAEAMLRMMGLALSRR